MYPHSLRIKLATLLIASLIGLIVILGLVLGLGYDHDQEQRLKSTLVQEAQIVSYAASAGLEFNDPKTVEGSIDLLKNVKEFISVSVFDSNGKIFVHKDFYQARPNAPVDAFAISVPVVNATHSVIGRIQARVTKKYLRDEIKRILSVSFSITFLVIGLVVGLGMWILRKLFMPLSRLKMIMDKATDAVCIPQADVESRDEVGELAASFNDMSQRINAARQELRGYQNHLEELVKERTEKLNEAKQKAEFAFQAKSQFLANMSHEIRTPMNAILGFSNLLSKTTLNLKQKQYLDFIATSGQLLLGIINDILDISKLESGSIQFEYIDVELKKEILDVMGMIVTRMKNKPFDTYVDIKEDVPVFVKTDPLRLKQILVNLAGNAIKFTAQGDIGVIVEKLDETADEVQLKFTIKDTGIGIGKEKQEHLFKVFSQADASTTRKYGGTGLGLVISKSIVEGLGGKIWLESEEGKGTCFYFTLKVQRSDKKQDNVLLLRQAQDLKDKTVFIVDDNRMAQKMIEKCCQTLHLTIMGFSSSPDEAVYALNAMIDAKTRVPDIILSDIMMEGMSGFDMVQVLKAKGSFAKTTFIAITSDLNVEQEHDPARQIFNAYVTKPISVEVLATALHGFTTETMPSSNSLEKTCAGLKVLVVEDVVANQILIEEYLSQLGCSFDMAANGQEALDKLRVAHDYDLCFMDLQMPVLGGVDAVRIIRQEISKDFPVIALSAAVMREEQDKAIAAGMNDFLMKPIDFNQLKEKILEYAKI